MLNFLTDEQLKTLVESIRIAENDSTGEIRVHIDSTTEVDNAQKAYQIFTDLCKDKTKEKNAVLFHVNFKKKYLTIIGDEGIHKHVKQEFWNQLHDKITQEFSQGHYFEGLQNGILETGKELKKYFPLRGENIDELSNEITFS